LQGYNSLCLPVLLQKHGPVSAMTSHGNSSQGGLKCARVRSVPRIPTWLRALLFSCMISRFVCKIGAKPSILAPCCWKFVARRQASWVALSFGTRSTNLPDLTGHQDKLLTLRNFLQHQLLHPSLRMQLCSPPRSGARPRWRPQYPLLSAPFLPGGLSPACPCAGACRRSMRTIRTKVLLGIDRGS
jgi:hypothetical protein